jgi:hypothetical protein
MTAQQYDLFAKTHQQTFDDWKETPEGGHTCNLFMRVAWGLWKSGFKKFGAKAVVERLRWHYAVRRHRNGQEWAINNNLTAYLARWAMDREPRLAGFFDVREIGSTNKPRRAVVVPIKEKTAFSG